MRHLKKYNESSRMIDTNNLGDILLELIDLGHICNVSSDWWSDRESTINVIIYGNEEKVLSGRGKSSLGFITLSESLETIKRVFSYLESEDYFADEDTSKILETLEESLTWKDPFILEKAASRKDRKVIDISRYKAIDFCWDKETNEWIFEGSLSLYFREKK